MNSVKYVQGGFVEMLYPVTLSKKKDVTDNIIGINNIKKSKKLTSIDMYDNIVELLEKTQNLSYVEARNKASRSLASYKKRYKKLNMQQRYEKLINDMKD